MNLIKITESTTPKQVTKGLKKIGTGAFTNCYALSDSQVLLVTVDPLKEVYSMGWSSDPLFPVTEKIDYLSTGECIYTMERYIRVSSLKRNLDADQYEIYKKLRHVFDNQFCFGSPRNIYDGYSILYKAFDAMEDKELGERMINVLDDIANYGCDIGFEISPRNVAVKDGKLILLDCFFLKGTLQKVRSA